MVRVTGTLNNNKTQGHMTRVRTQAATVMEPQTQQTLIKF